MIPSHPGTSTSARTIFPGGGSRSTTSQRAASASTRNRPRLVSSSALVVRTAPGPGGREESGAVRRAGGPFSHLPGHSFQAMWYTVLMSPSVESIVMKLTLPGDDVPAFTRSSVLMLKLRWTPQGA